MARPKMNEKDKKVALNTTISREDKEYLKKVGNGNASEGIRILILKSK